jgi:mitochondrial fission protein ELM1
MTTDPAVRVRHYGKAGMASQAIGLAEAAGFPLIEKHLTSGFAWSRWWMWPFQAAGHAGARPAPPWPDFAIACGRDAARPNLAVEPAVTGKPVNILDPDGGSAKSPRFHAANRVAGVTRQFCSRIASWTDPVPEDTAHAAAVLRALVLRRLEQRPPL